jgi:hypothetical protein
VLTLLLYALLAALVIGILFVAAVYFLPRGEELADPVPDSRSWAQLPRGRIRPDDVTTMRLPVALRGYRFAETDLLLDRLTDELRARDEEIERLRNGRATTSAVTTPAGAARPPAATWSAAAEAHPSVDQVSEDDAAAPDDGNRSGPHDT